MRERERKRRKERRREFVRSEARSRDKRQRELVSYCVKGRERARPLLREKETELVSY